MPITPTEADMISAAIDSALIDVHVALPAAIQSYDATTQTATVELQVQRVLPRGEGFATEDLPVLENVPVVFPRTKKFMLSFPIAEGDYGMVVFNEMSIDQWRSKGDNTSPGDIGRHTLTGGVFQPGLMPNSEAIADDVSEDLVLGEIAGVQVRIKPGGVCEVVSEGGPKADDWVAMTDKVLAAVGAAIDAAVLAAGAITPPAGDGGTAGFAAMKGAWATADLASTNLKADGEPEPEPP